jgi:hypothetical protein
MSFEVKALRYTNQIRLQLRQKRVRASYSGFIPSGDRPPLFDTYKDVQERIGN